MVKSIETITSEYVPETRTPSESKCDSENVTLQIKEEQLNLAKKWIQTGEVKIYRESFTEEKSFTVPIEREELVIEKIILASDSLEHKDGPREVIRILLSEEQVEYTKKRVDLEDVSIYKQEIADIEHITATIKKEEPRVKISGSLRIKDGSGLMHS